ncbi:hypothetical protein [Tuberibacillus sp. Marseille-P3662]|uniref:hypothetical protein n=1 Tax=Tuberibacillus sp. Marseille-P3662 TaxID=1965358 RepID=UPI000A1CD141|nr:hypothetical protein [Tuberibacillus sp. Marseille-P3662]
MGQKQCNVFLAESPDQSWMTFCTSDGYNKDEARSKIEEILENEKKASSYQLDYLGFVDFNDMEPGIAEQTDHFEKYDPVWLLNTSRHH